MLSGSVKLHSHIIETSINTGPSLSYSFEWSVHSHSYEQKHL